MGRSDVFFQLAATLIPLLLLAVAASDALNTRTRIRSATARKTVFYYAAPGLVLTLIAEIFAIELAFANDTLVWKASFVITALLGLVVATGVVLISPFWRAARRSRRGRLISWIVAAIAGVIVTAAGLGMTNAVYAAEGEGFAEQSACFRLFIREQGRLYQERVAAADEDYVRHSSRVTVLRIQRARLAARDDLAPGDKQARLAILDTELQGARSLSRSASRRVRESTSDLADSLEAFTGSSNEAFAAAGCGE